MTEAEEELVRPSRPSLGMRVPVKPKGFFESLYERTKRLIGHVGQVSDMAVGSVRAGFRRPFEGRSILQQLEALGVASMGIVVVTSVFIGMVMAVQFAFGLRKFGGMEYTGRVIALSFSRELAPTLTAVIVMPILAALALVLGFGGAMLITDLQFNVPAGFFLRSALQTVTMMDFASGMMKTPFFGAIIALVGCHFGMTTTGGTAGVGNSTTRTVVVISIAILIADFFLTKLAIIIWPTV